jgi:hypothetical protein
MSQLLRWKWKSEKPIATGIHNSELPHGYARRKVFCHLAQSFQGASIRPTYDRPQYPVEVLNRAADIFRMAGHMLGERLLLFLLRPGLVVFVDDGPQTFPRRRG